MALFWSDTDFLPWPGEVDLSRKKYEIRVTTDPVGSSAKITLMKLIVDVADILETLADVAIAAAGTRLPLVKTFRFIKNVLVTLQDDGGDAVSVTVIDKDTTGPLIGAHDLGGSTADATIDATVQGY